MELSYCFLDKKYDKIYDKICDKKNDIKNDKNIKTFNVKGKDTKIIKLDKEHVKDKINYNYSNKIINYKGNFYDNNNKNEIKNNEYYYYDDEQDLDSYNGLCYTNGKNNIFCFLNPQENQKDDKINIDSNHNYMYNNTHSNNDHIDSYHPNGYGDKVISYEKKEGRKLHTNNLINNMGTINKREEETKGSSVFSINNEHCGTTKFIKSASVCNFSCGNLFKNPKKDEDIYTNKMIGSECFNLKTGTNVSKNTKKIIPNFERHTVSSFIKNLSAQKNLQEKINNQHMMIKKNIYEKKDRRASTNTCCSTLGNTFTKRQVQKNYTNDMDDTYNINKLKCIKQKNNHKYENNEYANCDHYDDYNNMNTNHMDLKNSHDHYINDDKILVYKELLNNIRNKKNEKYNIRKKSKFSIEKKIDLFHMNSLNEDYSWVKNLRNYDHTGEKKNQKKNSLQKKFFFLLFIANCIYILKVAYMHYIYIYIFICVI
ncbi:hypothetical protein PFBG_00969 [Plasmodium falciparum 7G8]|uniref:Uncharacterized protein n=1 Tax=Plasmodium falciparum (isolate 7G8) TaxID=57266 RepID=W7FSP9_PLAF8|nr:hypothetical protein PFBG_00969 [Plasmodium falciparum 7G8]